MNFNCVYPSCDFKKNDIEEEEFLKHLNDVHHDEMKEIASMIKDVVIDKKEPGEMTGKIAEFRKEFQKTQYCFDNKVGAYEYIKLR